MTPNTMQNFYLHWIGGGYVLNVLPPTGSVQYKDSGSIDYDNGNPWKEIGNWTMVLQ